MYVIKVFCPYNAWNKEEGYFTCCYRCKSSNEESASTWIGFTHRKEEKELIKIFKTLKAAENKIKFLEEKIKENGYMWDWQLSVEKEERMWLS